MSIFAEKEMSPRRYDLGGDCAEPLCRQRFLVGGPGFFRSFALRLVEGVDRGTILRTHVIALTHALGRVVTFPKRLQQLIVRNPFRIEHDEHDFGMPGASRADFFVSWIFGVAARISRSRRVDGIAKLPEFAF